RSRTRRRLPGHQHAVHRESWRTKIIYGGKGRLTALFAESGLIARVRARPTRRPGAAVADVTGGTRRVLN
ncbi:MAG: hypothetical protein ACRDOL_10770, partial [Streptosporangiaceae bacterium]